MHDVRLVRFVVLILLLFGSRPIAGSPSSGSELLLPVVGRGPGAQGSIWRTDIVLTNVSSAEALLAEVTFYPEGEVEGSLQVVLQPRASVTYRDVVRSVFGHEEANGIVILRTEAPSAALTARARIYNAGGWQGEFGQTSHAIPLDSLGREVYLGSLDRSSATRTNIGIANPHDLAASVVVNLFTAEGNRAGGFPVEVEPRSVLRINRIFDRFAGAPVGEATIVLSSSRPVYGYASIVRNDSGDADFVSGVIGSRDDSVVVTPPCADPAPLGLAPAGREAPGWIVGLEEGSDATQVAQTLASRLGFVVTSVYETLPAFLADLDHDQIAEIRCEDAVIWVEQNAYVIFP